MKPLKKILLLAGLLLLFSPLLKPQEEGGEKRSEVEAKSVISSVTVFPDRAMVVREASLDLAPGASPVSFSGLPASLMPNSIRVTGRGTAVVKILGIDLAGQFVESPWLPEIKKLQAEIEAVEMEIAKVKSGVEVIESQEKFLASIEASASAKASQDIGQARPDVASWEKALDFIGSKLQALKLAKLERSKAIKEHEVKLDALKKKLAAIKPPRPLEGKKATALLDVERAGSFQISLSYAVANARWHPVYSIRALPDTRQVELSVSASVIQKSGEDWQAVKVFLSTSSPALEATPPELNPWFLNISRPSLALRDEARVVGKITAAPPAELQAEAVAMAPMREAETASAAVLETGLHLNFEIQRPADVPSDGSAHKFPIDSKAFDVKFDYTSVPKLKEAAFLRGAFKNTLPYPLLPGEADLFILQDYVGSAQIPRIAMEEEAKLFFGQDSQIEVKHEQVKREKAPPGFLGKTERLNLIYRITIRNLRKTPVEMEIQDQVPVSQNQKIEVKDVKISPPPSKKEENGILTWTLTLAPQEKKEILIDFAVEYPKDADVFNLQ